jgi:hypothetical protein
MNKIKNIVFVILLSTLVSNYGESKFAGLNINDNYIEIYKNGISVPASFEHESITYLKKKLPNANRLLEDKIAAGMNQVEMFNFIRSKEFNELMKVDFELLNSGEQKTCLAMIELLNDLITAYGKFFHKVKSEGLKF